MNEADGSSPAVDTRLAVYGSLAPGEVNHHQLSALAGAWRRGTVRGYRRSAGWGSALGFPGLVLDPAGPEVGVQVFESAELPRHWTRLDEFEGEGYRRVVTEVKTAGGELAAWIYVLADNQV
ncbi:MAG: gamma-glutamylcyclotransferase [Paludibaculum sp.]